MRSGPTAGVSSEIVWTAWSVYSYVGRLARHPPSGCPMYVGGIPYRLLATDGMDRMVGSSGAVLCCTVLCCVLCCAVRVVQQCSMHCIVGKVLLIWYCSAAPFRFG